MMRMKLYEAKVVDLIRSQQRDETFTTELNAEIDALMKLCGLNFYNRHQTNIERIAKIWYYLNTSCSNLQTLGEEYAGILRIVEFNQTPSIFRQLLWMVLYIGGEDLYKRLLGKWLKDVKAAGLRDEPKKKLTIILSYLLDNQTLLIRLHQAMFYVFGNFHNLSNRLTNIRYILLRDWMQDQTSSKSIQFFGYCYLLYLILYLLRHETCHDDKDDVNEDISGDSNQNDSKMCTLCGDSRKNTSVTPCGHLYCWDCIHKSMKYYQYCPACREKLIPSRIVYLQNYK